MTNVSISPGAAGAGKGDTVPSDNETRVPRTPNEHDESADSLAAQEPSGQIIGNQALQDIKRGLVDTGTSPVVGATYDKVRRR